MEANPNAIKSNTTATTEAAALPCEKFKRELVAEQAQAKAEPAEERAKREAAAEAIAAADKAVLKAEAAAEEHKAAAIREARAAAAKANEAEEEAAAAKAKEIIEESKKEATRAAEFETRIINASHVADANEEYTLRKAFPYVFEDSEPREVE